MSMDAGALDAAAAAATAAPGRIRSLDDRLTVLAVRMVYVSFSFFFAGFYFALIYLQLVNEDALWKPASLHQPTLWLGLLEMALVLAAGVIYFWGQWTGLYQRDFGRLKLALWSGSVLLLVSVILHIAELHKPGFSLQDGGYASVFVGLEGTFTVVLAVTTLIIFGMANRARLGLFRQSGIAVDAFGEWLGWVSALALLNFLGLYLQPFFHSA